MSPRPRKPRRCRHMGDAHAYKPIGVRLSGLPAVTLAADELEALRLCDLQGLTQEEAGAAMGVSRGTIQRTIKQARRKVVEALLTGAALQLPRKERRP